MLACVAAALLYLAVGADEIHGAHGYFNLVAEPVISIHGSVIDDLPSLAPPAEHHLRSQREEVLRGGSVHAEATKLFQLQCFLALLMTTLTIAHMYSEDHINQEEMYDIENHRLGGRKERSNTASDPG